MTKADLYRNLAALYHYTPEEIANMTPTQQYEMLNLTDDERRNILTFNTLAEVEQWRTKRR